MTAMRGTLKKKAKPKMKAAAIEHTVMRPRAASMAIEVSTANYTYNILKQLSISIIMQVFWGVGAN